MEQSILSALTIVSGREVIKKSVALTEGVLGVGGIDTLLALPMTEGVHKHKTTVQKLVKLTPKNLWIYPEAV